MKNWKEKLEEFYKRINPDKKDFECYKDAEISELREIRNMFNDEASKYQKLIDGKILQQNDASKYKDKYIQYKSENFVMHVKEVVRKYNGFSLLGTLIAILENTIDICLDGDIFIHYGETDNLKIISEKEYKRIVSKHLKDILRKANL